MSNETSDAVRRAGSSVADTVRDNPVGAALLGMGLVWLISSRINPPPSPFSSAVQSAGDEFASRASSLRNAARKTSASVADYAGPAVDAVRETADMAARKARDVAADLAKAAHIDTDGADAYLDAASDYAEKASAYGRHAVKDLRKSGERALSDVSGKLSGARGWLATALDEQPLLLAAGGLAIGVAIAATIPVARTQARNVGDAARDLAEDASDFVKDAAAKAGERVSDAADALGKEAKRHGINSDVLTDEAAALRDKATDTLKGAANAIGSVARDASKAGASLL